MERLHRVIVMFGVIMLAMGGVAVAIDTTGPVDLVGPVLVSSPDTTVNTTLALRQANDLHFGFDIDVEQNQVGRLDLYRVIGNGRTQVLSILRGNGNVGIGTMSPAAKLHVAGEIIADDVLVGLVSVADLIDTVNALQAQVDDLENALAAVDVSALQGQIDTLTTHMSTVETSITTIEAALKKPGASGISRY